MGASVGNPSVVLRSINVSMLAQRSEDRRLQIEDDGRSLPALMTRKERWKVRRVGVGDPGGGNML